jgi:hypothetical protein
VRAAVLPVGAKRMRCPGARRGEPLGASVATVNKSETSACESGVSQTRFASIPSARYVTAARTGLQASAPLGAGAYPVEQ